MNRFVLRTRTEIVRPVGHVISVQVLIALMVLPVVLVYTGCKIDPGLDTLGSSLIIEGLTADNYPKVDGSTSTEPLNTIIACKLFGIRYKWAPHYWNLQRIEPNLNGDDTEKLFDLVKSSQTHQSFLNLINKEADLILSARKMSPDEKTAAGAAGLTLIETPVALDAFVFIVNPGNPVNSLTTKQIQDIYTKKITNWGELGWAGDSAPSIIPYVRNANSGSQELMETLVMKDLDMAEFFVNYDELIVFNMTGAVDRVFQEYNAICYTVYYFKEYMVTGINVKSLAVDGIYPGRETIGNRSYPYTAEVYAVIRSGLDKSSMAYKLYEWLQTPAGKQAIGESGYVPITL
ncbi:MAG: substrate-binding domain-containing protein [Treponema sp.]|nr:substrate-binding domain-containing protein [Treponema sp.]